jgi:hypothetical protein
MRRREFITLLGGAVAAPSILRPLAAQQPRMPRVGIVTIQSRETSIYVAFDQRLRELGYIEGQNLAIVFLNPGTQIDGVGEAVKELVRRKVDVIVASLRERSGVSPCGYRYRADRNARNYL